MTDGRCPYCHGVQNSAGACFTMNCPGAFSAIGSQFSNLPHPLAADPRDAALLAPLRAENALLRAEATAHMGVARAAEAEVARLREALTTIRDLTEEPYTERAAARALAEGQP